MVNFVDLQKEENIQIGLKLFLIKHIVISQSRIINCDSYIE